MKRFTNRNRKKNRRGFTLMEILLVMAILVVLGSLVTVAFQQIRRNADKDNAKLQINMLKSACEAYNMRVGTYPPDLNALRQPPQGMDVQVWGGPHLTEDVPTDPWGGTYQYQVANDEYGNTNAKIIISTNGRDGQQGTDDDVSSETRK